jgi:hypothetical protein
MNVQSVLERCLAQRFGVERRIVDLRRTVSEYRSSFAIENLDIHLDDSARLQLVFKDLSRSALLEEARLAKPAFIYNPIREIHTYDRILSSSGLGTAACYGFLADARANRYWLFLENVPGIELYQSGELSAWSEAARWLAGMHSRLRSQAEQWGAHCQLLRYDANFYRLWLSRAQQFCNDRDAVDLLARHYDRVVERLLALPQTFIHGEFYASNVMICATNGDSRICALDWETAAIGPALIDLAALTSGKWNEAERKQIALAYRDRLKAEAAFGHKESVDVFLEDLEYCRLHLCMQWLGWARDWSPPRDHAHDWLAEAMTIAERLGL